MSGPRALSTLVVAPLSADPARTYASVVDIALAAETSGYETIWVAEGHFTFIGLPSSLPVLAAIAARTTRLRLGTGVIPLAFQSPLAVAENAAVVDALSLGRIELGIGKGNGHGLSRAAFDAYALDERDRETLYDTATEELKAHLRGTSQATPPMHPPGHALLDRIWQATGNLRTATRTGAAGDGLQLHRSTPTGIPGDVQAELAERYLDALPDSAAPRIGVSRVVLPAADRADALRWLEADVAARPDDHPQLRPGVDLAHYLAESNVAYGHPDDIVEQLAADRAVALSTELIVSVAQPLDSTDYPQALALVADRIFPALSSTPALHAVPAERA